MSFKINNAFLLKSTSQSVVKHTNMTNNQLKNLIEEELIEQYLKMIFKYFVILKHKKKSEQNLNTFLSYITENDIITNFIVNNNDYSNNKFLNSVLDLVFFSKSTKLNSDLNKDCFIYHKTLGSKTYYVVDSFDNLILKNICIKILNNDDINLKPYDCNFKNEYSNQNEWEKVLEGEDIYTSMSRLQISYENYAFKIIEKIHKNIESVFLSEEEIKTTVYYENKYLENISIGKGSLIASIDTKFYFENCKYDNLDLNKSIISREELIKQFKLVI